MLLGILCPALRDFTNMRLTLGWLGHEVGADDVQCVIRRISMLGNWMTDSVAEEGREVF